MRFVRRDGPRDEMHQSAQLPSEQTRRRAHVEIAQDGKGTEREDEEEGPETQAHLRDKARDLGKTPRTKEERDARNPHLLPPSQV